MVDWETCKPDLIKAEVGWLATTPTDHPYRVGVVGATEAEVRTRFRSAMAAWEELHELVEAERRSAKP